MLMLTGQVYPHNWYIALVLTIDNRPTTTRTYWIFTISSNTSVACSCTHADTMPGMWDAHADITLLICRFINTYTLQISVHLMTPFLRNRFFSGYSFHVTPCIMLTATDNARVLVPGSVGHTPTLKLINSQSSSSSSAAAAATAAWLVPANRWMEAAWSTCSVMTKTRGLL